MRNPLPKRFYEKACVLERDGLFHVALDGRTARTPARKHLAVASRPVAEALAAEWEAQTAEIDPSRMPMTRLVNSALDGVRLAVKLIRVAARIPVELAEWIGG